MALVNQALIIVARYPFGGAVKTRLAAALGPTATAGLYAAFLRDTFCWASNAHDFELLVSLADSRNREAFAEAFSLPIVSIFGQVGEDFGDRLYHSLRVAFKRGFLRAAVAASDAPDLSQDDVIAAFDALDDHDLSIIPSPDGGYSFLGLNEPLDVFSGVEMSTASVLEDTLTLARANSLSTAILPPVPDVDDVADLESLISRLNNDARLRARLPHTHSYIQSEI